MDNEPSMSTGHDFPPPAIRWFGSNWPEVSEFLGQDYDVYAGTHPDNYVMRQPDGTVIEAELGDWITRRTDGRISVSKTDPERYTRRTGHRLPGPFRDANPEIAEIARRCCPKEKS